MASKDNPSLAAVSEEAAKLLSTTFEKLKDSTTVKTAEGERLFFPYGIELIFVKVEAGLNEKTKVSAEVRIAGERGIEKPKESVAATESGMLEVESTVE